MLFFRPHAGQMTTPFLKIFQSYWILNFQGLQISKRMISTWNAGFVIHTAFPLVILHVIHEHHFILGNPWRNFFYVRSTNICEYKWNVSVARDGFEKLRSILLLIFVPNELSICFLILIFGRVYACWYLQMMNWEKKVKAELIMYATTVLAVGHFTASVLRIGCVQSLPRGSKFGIWFVFFPATDIVLFSFAVWNIH